MNEIVDLARSWINTPYQHQASVKGIGCDCLGLVRGIYSEFYDKQAEQPPIYALDWSDVSKTEILLEAMDRNLVRCSTVDFSSGSVLAFRLHKTGVVKHLGLAVGIRAGSVRMIHSYARKGVVETPIGYAWQRKCVAQFKFPKE